MVSIILTIVLTACATDKVEVSVPKTELVVYTPDKIPLPLVPKFYTLNNQESIDSISNFTKLQKNTVLLTEYVKSLLLVIEQYEKQIDKLNELK